MTLRDLSQLNYLQREIQLDARRLQKLEASAASCTAPPGMPCRGPGVGDRTGRYAAQIADLRSVIEAKQQRCLTERAQLEWNRPEVSEVKT